MRRVGTVRWAPVRARRGAALAVVAALVVVAAIVVVDGANGPAALALGGAALLTAAVVGGVPALAVIGSCAQLGAAAIAVTLDVGDEAQLAAVPLGLLVWFGAELSWSALEHRTASRPTPAWRARRVGDLALLGLVAGVVGGLALVAASGGPRGGGAYRIGALAVVVLVLAGAWWVSRPAPR
ncbi:hypothetical protein [Actinomarinicola tropica]|uniref:Uncharacterized protein n=1 Tax=Actinomarinicola tropica TaxID=2789776 RepID=A0A5Q2RQY6_9ACTN|nr:hypothetical protein [Actinomarinicola tropica]QGG96846.1 hypothetical protein GH723_18045 [Actinomarinicola tropica]